MLRAITITRIHFALLTFTGTRTRSRTHIHTLLHIPTRFAVCRVSIHIAAAGEFVMHFMNMQMEIFKYFNFT